MASDQNAMQNQDRQREAEVKDLEPKKDPKGGDSLSGRHNELLGVWVPEWPSNANLAAQWAKMD